MGAENGSGRTLHVQVRVASRDNAFSLDIDFEAPPGITILFGPSGSGKSTALAAIAGLVRPDAGRITLGDDVLFDASARIDRPVHRRHVAFVFQSLALFPHITAVANVAYGMDRALSRDARAERARELLARLGVGHLADRKPPTFSGGEAQRVALARAFATAPKIALFDEPFSALDRELRRDLVSDVRAFVAELGVPLVHVTHQRNEARALGDRVVMLDRGRVTSVGGIEELLRARPPSAPTHDATFDEMPLHAHDRLPEPS
jgi:molybdate transport system ATP-binding protein